MALCPQCPSQLVPKKHSPTPLSWSPTILYQHLPSTTIDSILPDQFTCLTIFLHNFSPSPLWSTSRSAALHFILHTFLHLIRVFFKPFLSQSTCSRLTWQTNSIVVESKVSPWRSLRLRIYRFPCVYVSRRCEDAVGLLIGVPLQQRLLTLVHQTTSKTWQRREHEQTHGNNV